MRALAASSFALLFLAGCAPGADGELRALVEEASLPGISEWSCEWGSSGFDSDPRAWYGCWGELPWTLEKTSRTVKARLVARGYGVTVERGAAAFYFTAVRESRTLCVDVLGAGWTGARNTYRDQLPVEPGESVVDVWTVKARPGQARCPFLPDLFDE